MKRAPASTLTLFTVLALSCGDGEGGPAGPGEPTEPLTGSIQVSLVMSGADMDSDGCVVTVDGSSGQRLTSGATVAFSRLSAGAHEIAIHDVAANCRVNDGA